MAPDAEPAPIAPEIKPLDGDWQVVQINGKWSAKNSQTGEVKGSFGKPTIAQTYADTRNQDAKPTGQVEAQAHAKRVAEAQAIAEAHAKEEAKRVAEAQAIAEAHAKEEATKAAQSQADATAAGFKAQQAKDAKRVRNTPEQLEEWRRTYGERRKALVKHLAYTGEDYNINQIQAVLGGNKNAPEHAHFAEEVAAFRGAHFDGQEKLKPGEKLVSRNWGGDKKSRLPFAQFREGENVFDRPLFTNDMGATAKQIDSGLRVSVPPEVTRVHPSIVFDESTREVIGVDHPKFGFIEERGDLKEARENSADVKLHSQRRAGGVFMLKQEKLQFKSRLEELEKEAPEVVLRDGEVHILGAGESKRDDVNLLAKGFAEIQKSGNRPFDNPIPSIIREQVINAAQDEFSLRLRLFALGKGARPQANRILASTAKLGLGKMKHFEGMNHQASLDAPIGTGTTTVGEMIADQTQLGEHEGVAPTHTADAVDAVTAHAADATPAPDSLAPAAPAEQQVSVADSMVTRAMAEGMTPATAKIWAESRADQILLENGHDKQDIADMTMGEKVTLLDELRDDGVPVVFTPSETPASPEVAAANKAAADKLGLNSDSPDKLGDALKIIADDPSYPAVLRTLARIILKSGISTEGVTLVQEGQNNAKWAGAYSGGGNPLIRLNNNVVHEGSLAQSLLHEAIHHITLAKLEENYQLSPLEQGALDRLTELKAEFAKHVYEQKVAEGFQGTQDEFFARPGLERLYYGLSETGGMKEFLTELQTNPKFQEALDKVTGLKGNILQRIWQAFKEFVTGRVVAKGSLLDAALDRAKEFSFNEESQVKSPEGVSFSRPADSSELHQTTEDLKAQKTLEDIALRYKADPATDDMRSHVYDAMLDESVSNADAVRALDHLEAQKAKVEAAEARASATQALTRVPQRVKSHAMEKAALSLSPELRKILKEQVIYIKGNAKEDLALANDFVSRHDSITEAVEALDLMAMREARGEASAFNGDIDPNQAALARAIIAKKAHALQLEAERGPQSLEKRELSKFYKNVSIAQFRAIQTALHNAGAFLVRVGKSLSTYWIPGSAAQDIKNPAVKAQEVALTGKPGTEATKEVIATVRAEAAKGAVQKLKGALRKLAGKVSPDNSKLQNALEVLAEYEHTGFPVGVDVVDSVAKRLTSAMIAKVENVKDRRVLEVLEAQVRKEVAAMLKPLLAVDQAATDPAEAHRKVIQKLTREVDNVGLVERAFHASVQSLIANGTKLTDAQRAALSGAKFRTVDLKAAQDVIRKSLKMQDMVREHLSDQNATLDTLTQEIINSSPGISEAHATAVAEALEAAYRIEAGAAATKMLERLNTVKGAVKSIVAPFEPHKKILDLVNLGALSDEKMQGLVARTSQEAVRKSLDMPSMVRKSAAEQSAALEKLTQDIIGRIPKITEEQSAQVSGAIDNAYHTEAAATSSKALERMLEVKDEVKRSAKPFLPHDKIMELVNLGALSDERMQGVVARASKEAVQKNLDMPDLVRKPYSIQDAALDNLTQDIIGSIPGMTHEQAAQVAQSLQSAYRAEAAATSGKALERMRTVREAGEPEPILPHEKIMELVNLGALSDERMNDVIAKTAQGAIRKNLDLQDLVRKPREEQDAALDNLTHEILSSIPGISEAHAVQVAEALKTAYGTESAWTVEKALEQMRAVKSKEQGQPVLPHDKIMELVNLGALSDERMQGVVEKTAQDAIRKNLNIPDLVRKSASEQSAALDHLTHEVLSSIPGISEAHAAAVTEGLKTAYGVEASWVNEKALEQMRTVKNKEKGAPALLHGKILELVNLGVFTDERMRGVVEKTAQGVVTKNLDMPDLVRKSMTEQGTALDSLTQEVLSGMPDISAAHAAQVAEALKTAYHAEAQATSEKAMERMRKVLERLRTQNKAKSDPIPAHQKIMELVNLGAFSDSKMQEVVAHTVQEVVRKNLDMEDLSHVSSAEQQKALEDFTKKILSNIPDISDAHAKAVTEALEAAYHAEAELVPRPSGGLPVAVDIINAVAKRLTASMLPNAKIKDSGALVILEAQIRKEVTAQLLPLITKEKGKLDPAEARKQLIEKLTHKIDNSDLAERAFNASVQSLLARGEKLTDAQRAALSAARFNPLDIRGAREFVRNTLAMQDMVRSHPLDQNASLAKLTQDVLSEHPELSAEHATAVATALKTAYDAEAKAAAEKTLSRLTKVKDASEKPKPLLPHDKIAELVNLGVFSDEKLFNEIAIANPSMNLPVWDAKLVADIERASERIYALPEGSDIKNAAIVQLMSKIAYEHSKSLTGFAKFKYWLTDVGPAIWQAGVLSGPPTQAINAAGTAFNVQLQAGFNAFGYHATLGLGKVEGIGFYGDVVRGFAAAVGWTRSGSVAYNDAKQSLLTGSARFRNEIQQNLSILEHGKAGFLHKYVGRVAMMADAYNTSIANEVAQRQAFRFAQLNMGKRGSELAQAMLEAFHPGNDIQDRVNAQIARETATGLFGEGKELDRNILSRRYELLESIRFEGTGLSGIQEQGRETAERWTFNNRAKGVAGVILDGALGSINRHTGVSKYFLSFLNTQGNLLNVAMELSPFGIANAFNLSPGQHIQEKYRLPNMDVTTPEGRAARNTMLAKGILGTMAMAALAAMVWRSFEEEKDGKEPYFAIYGPGPTNSWERRQWQQGSGWQPNTVKIGSARITYTDIPGLAQMLGGFGVLADMMRFDKKIADKDMTEVTMLWGLGMMNSIMEKKMLSGISNLFKIIQNPDVRGIQAFKQSIGGVVGGFTNPQLLRWARSTFDTNSNGQVEVLDQSSTAGWVHSMIPFSYGNNSPAMNVLGQPVTQAPWEATAKRFFTIPEKDHPIFGPLVRNGITISSPNKLAQISIPGRRDKVAVGRSGAAWRRFVEVRGQEITRVLTPAAAQKVGGLGKERGQDLLQNITTKASARAVIRIQNEIRSGALVW